ncbi:hypothetical protein BDR05DRAFT_756686, partial [Suillus weaverae]
VFSRCFLIPAPSQFDFKAQDSNLIRILAIDTPVRDACIAGDLSTAEKLLTQEINADANKHASYVNRSFVMARKHHWDHALQDAIKSISIQPSLIGCISKGIALGGKGNIRDSIQAFDLAFTFANEDPKIIVFLLLIKAIAIFNAGQHEEAIIRVQELAATCRNDILACRMVEAYLRVQLVINALDVGRHDEAADHFTAAVKMNIFSSRSAIHFGYDDFVVLFGWDLASLWMTANQKRCRALLQAGRLSEAIGSYQHMMDVSDITTKADSLDWFTVFKEECSALFAANGDAAFTTCDYDRAINLYSAAIELDPASDTIFAKRSKAKSGKMLWIEALHDAQKVIELNPSSYLGYDLKHTALHGAQRYDEAIQAFQIMMSKLHDAAYVPTQKLPQQYLSPSGTALDIRKVIDAQLENAPFRVLDTTTGLLCDREAQISAFKTSVEYKELVSSTITHPDFRMKRIKEIVVTYFRYAMLSHRWEGKEPLLQDIQDKVLYELNPVGGMVKLQSFCKIARRAGCRWAWSDTCCIDKSNSVEHQEAINSMFVWYQHSALTIIYLSDVPPSSKSGALANSAWNTRGWTAQELLASKVILFYQKDWTLYLDDRSLNHKESAAIMQELEHATGIDRRAIAAFRPGMTCARETLQWASTRVTTLQEDVAYSLSGVFGIRLRVDYGEKKQCALGRLLQKVVAHSGDITALDWVGKPSEFNSCLPADITSYEAPPCKLPSLSEADIQSSVSSLRGTVALESASRLYQTLDYLSAPRFAHRRLHLPCIVFPVTEVGRKPGQNKETHFTYGVKADGLHDLDITTEDRLPRFSREMPPPTWRTFLLVRTWSCHLLELPDPADDTKCVEDWTVSESTLPPSENEPVYSESHSRALRLIVRLGQPFGAFLLARQRNGVYKRIASDRNIIAQVKDMTSVGNLMDIRTLEIM